MTPIDCEDCEREDVIPMRTPDPCRIEEAKAASLASHTKQPTKVTLLCLLTVFVIFVLPQVIPSPLNHIAGVAGAAASFIVFFSFYHQSLRTRHGSLTPAFCLLAFIWLSAAVVTLLSLNGKIE